MRVKDRVTADKDRNLQSLWWGFVWTHIHMSGNPQLEVWIGGLEISTAGSC